MSVRFWYEKGFCRELTKSETQGSHFYVKQLHQSHVHHMQMTRRLPFLCALFIRCVFLPSYAEKKNGL